MPQVRVMGDDREHVDRVVERLQILIVGSPDLTAGDTTRLKHGSGGGRVTFDVSAVDRPAVESKPFDPNVERALPGPARRSTLDDLACRSVEQQRRDVIAHAEQLGLRVVDPFDRTVTDAGPVYRDRARLIALLAALYPSAISANDQEAPGWPVVYVHTPRGQLAWHLSPRELDLFEHVEQIAPDVQDLRTAWDGHDSADKYQRIRWLIDDAVGACAASGQG